MQIFRRFGFVAAGAVLMLALAGVAAASGSNAVVNGDFQTGSLAPWSTFTTSNGTISGGDVQMFDTTGSGASYAAHFNVGQVSFVDGDYEGGGIYQNFYGSGTYTVSADVAVHEPSGAANASCGNFELLLDGTVVASHNFGGYPSTCLSGQTLRDHLSGAVNTSFALGLRQVEVRITRPYTTVGITPDEYVDNVLVIRKLTKA
jgi:hypothetical protein